MRGLGLLGVSVCGLVAGWIAARVLRRRQDPAGWMATGVAGALLGDWIAEAIGLNFAGLGGGLVLATVGAVILLAVYALLVRGR